MHSIFPTKAQLFLCDLKSFVRKLLHNFFKDFVNLINLLIFILPIIFEIKYFIWKTNLTIEIYREIDVIFF